MTRFGTIMAFCLSFILSSFYLSMGAQSLSSLPKASNVSTGTLPNGISYYLVANGGSKGYADFALVQKGAVSEEQSKSALTELPHFQSGKPYQYLAKLGVGYEKNGQFRKEDGSVTYDFKHVPVSKQDVRDTVLLLLFDISETFPYEQAVIVSGDIDSKAIMERINVFSMMVTQRDKAPSSGTGLWQPSENMNFSFTEAPDQLEAVLAVSYSSARTPQDAMGTVQPLVLEMFASELGSLLESRVRILFRELNIPLAEVNSVYRSSADGPGDECFTLTVTVPASRMSAASAALATVLSELDASGASLPEFSSVRRRVLDSFSASKDLSDAEWVEKCRSSYLYGSSLASPEAVREFFATRDIAEGRELELFNSFVSALLDRERALDFSVVAPGSVADGQKVQDSFRAGWDASASVQPHEYAVNGRDTLGLYAPRKLKVKLKRSVPEPLTGGEMWTFSNGMRVIYKKSEALKGAFSYGFLINGGYADVPSLSRGEGGFISDMLLLDDIAGMSSDSFSRMLSANGIGFRPSVSLTGLTITGSAPSSKLTLLLKSLLSVANSRSVNGDAYSYYRESERLRLSVSRKRQEGINAAVDSIVCPDYLFTGYKDAAALSDDLPFRAEQYFARRFGKCDDGVLVLVGDLDPFAVKKVLQNHLGGFATGGAPSVRPQIKYNLRSGASTYTVDSEDSSVGNGERSVTVSQSALLPFTLERYFASEVAAMEIGKALAAALCDEGMSVDIAPSFSVFPEEMFSIRISCAPAEWRGLPSGVRGDDLLMALVDMRSALSELAAGGGQGSLRATGWFGTVALSDQSVAESKTELQHRYERSLQRPETLVDAALMRYSVGKDVVTGYKDKIASVTSSTVRELISALQDGSKVEYIIY